MKKLLFILLLLASSCNPYRFYLNYSKADLYEVYTMSSLESVKKSNDNSILMVENTRVSIRNFTVVNNLIQFNLELLEGNGIKFALRNVRHQYDENKSFLMKI